jgi:hypothetical protein
MVGTLGTILFLLLASGAPASAAMRVYTTDGLTRVRPNDRPLSTPTAAIRAARNEYEPFQVVVRADRRALTGVRVLASDLRTRDGRVIPRTNITLYREHYVRVRHPSPRSREGAGWYPDALIPFLNPIDGRPVTNARFVGVPFDVAADANQPVWVDVFVPSNASPGEYEGTVTVTANSEPSVTIPVRLTVWNITLPDTPSMRTNFGKLDTNVARAHRAVMNSEEFRVPEWNYAATLAAHRIAPTIPNTLYPEVREDGSIDPSRTHDGLKRWMDTFHVTGFPIRLLGDDPAGRDRARNITHLGAMYAYLVANGWEKTAYVYVLDEPNDAAAYREVRRRAKMIHDAEPGIQVLCTEQTKPERKAWGTIAGGVDIWCPLWTLFDEASAAERLREGDELWSYTALCQGRRGRDTPYWQIDFPLLDFRIPMWMSWRYGVTGLLYWSAVNWQRGDVWTDPVTYVVGGTRYNGEGALLYPGADAGFAGPVASMRLKQIREGLEDYEYLKLLADRGDRAFADAVARRLARSWTNWDERPAALYAAREEIARRLQTPRR